MTTVLSLKDGPKVMSNVKKTDKRQTSNLGTYQDKNMPLVTQMGYKIGLG